MSNLLNGRAVTRISDGLRWANACGWFASVSRSALLFLFLPILLAPGTPGIHADEFRVAPADIVLQVSPDTKLDSSNEVPKTVRIVVPRGGTASGQVVVWSGTPVGQLSGTLSEFAGLKATCRVRYPTRCSDLSGDKKSASWKLPYFDALSPTLVPGESVQPVVITVQVSADAAPGKYTGSLALTGGPSAANVPVELVVTPFVLPPATKRRMWMATYHSMDSVWLRYNVRPFSERYWQLQEPAIRLLGELGDCVMYAPVVSHTWHGHEHGLVQVRRAGDDWTPDFAAFDRYLALYSKYCRPRIVILGVWEPSVVDGGEWAGKVWLSEVTTNGPVAFLAKAYDHPDFWKKVVDGVAQRLEKAGIDRQSLRLGISSDTQPTGEHFSFFLNAAPAFPAAGGSVPPDTKWAGVTWAAFTHGYGGIPSQVSYIEAPDLGATTLPVRGGLPGKGRVTMNTVRDRHENEAPGWIFRAVPDTAVGATRYGPSPGLARVGLDFWPLPTEGKDSKGRDLKPWSVFGRYRLNGPNRLYRHLTSSLTVAGPEGAIPTVRYEQIREGTQEVEARLVLEEALTKNVLTGDVKTQAEAALTDYAGGNRDAMSRKFTPGWQERSLRLFTLASQAQAAGIK